LFQVERSATSMVTVVSCVTDMTHHSGASDFCKKRCSEIASESIFAKSKLLKPILTIIRFSALLFPL